MSMPISENPLINYLSNNPLINFLMAEAPPEKIYKKKWKVWKEEISSSRSLDFKSKQLISLLEAYNKRKRVNSSISLEALTTASKITHDSDALSKAILLSKLPALDRLKVGLALHNELTKPDSGNKAVLKQLHAILSDLIKKDIYSKVIYHEIKTLPTHKQFSAESRVKRYLALFK